jgi:hypothetical protein
MIPLMVALRIINGLWKVGINLSGDKKDPDSHRSRISIKLP